ncbi:MAG: hypothetical protein ABJN69_02290 [Hellea sp.]
MKKTEKIEVRLSHEEKTALTTLAEQEDRSVSDLVRGLIERYMSINTTRLPRKIPWLLFGAVAVGGFFLGHIATYLIAKSHSRSHSPIYNLSINIGSSGINSPILAKDGEIITSIIPFNNGDIRVEAAVSNVAESLQTVKISLCRKNMEACDKIASPVLKFNPNANSVIQFTEQNGQDIYISLAPTISAHK